MPKHQMPKTRNPRMNKTMDYRKGSADFPMKRPRYNRNTIKNIREEI